MAESTNEANAYTMGYSEEFRQLLDRRSLQTHGAHLAPHLRAGQRVLDFGCGPGTITVGLAGAVEPGEVHGIDMEESQIELARAAAEAGGHGNAIFHVGNVTELPFEDNFFDVAHCHAVLMHVPDTDATLAEVKRGAEAGRDHRQPGDGGGVVLRGAIDRRAQGRVDGIRQPDSGERGSSTDGTGAEGGGS